MPFQLRDKRAYALFCFFIHTDVNNTLVKSLLSINKAIYDRKFFKMILCHERFKISRLFAVNVDEKWTECGETELVDSEGFITSPLYPREYPPNTLCRWTIAAEPGRTILLGLMFLQSCTFFIKPKNITGSTTSQNY